MNDKDKLDRLISGPEFFDNSPAWDFEYRKNGRAYRKWRVFFIASKRQFEVIGIRRVSKRKKRRPVAVSGAMKSYIRGRLGEQEVAICAQSALLAGMSQPTVDSHP